MYCVSTSSSVRQTGYFFAVHRYVSTDSRRPVQLDIPRVRNPLRNQLIRARSCRRARVNQREIYPNVLSSPIVRKRERDTTAR